MKISRPSSCLANEKSSHISRRCEIGTLVMEPHHGLARDRQSIGNKLKRQNLKNQNKDNTGYWIRQLFKEDGSIDMIH
ncbi:hypothetical protein NPIL_282831 [Nephila pilipes]|uniref:Uncharacterized protein n=1 Tax=Nephila pilipes TaxID=299642 RepID=A0A8X6Q9N3_NEPPI|nr:hypothetical protein NPIL_282831 [Nephila pilipes]